MSYRIAIFVIALVLSPRAVVAAEVDASVPAYVGSAACTDCHQEAAEAWAPSHHAWAWKTPDAASVLGDFDGAEFHHKGVTSRFTTEGERFVIETDGPDGAITRFGVVGTAGVAPLQQYLLEIEPGRQQAVDLAWDVENRRWYHLYPDQDLSAGDGLHWTGPYKSWNARCAECHATGYDKNYDPRARRYVSTEAEIGVGCEACHGPGEAHLAWATAPDATDYGSRPGLTEKGFTIQFDPASPETEIQHCASCHARREPFFDGNPLPGTPFHDAYRLALLRPGLYHADGSIQDEVYVYGSFLQSKMYANGVRCSDCHEPHAATLKADGNGVCTQCHSPAGNDRFPTLAKALYDDPAHHFHEPGSDGAQCASCHMIERIYMGIDGRRDHSFRIPRPDLSEATGSPNSCTDCHQDMDAGWAADEIARRFPDSRHRGPHFATPFARAATDPGAASEALMEIGEHDRFPGIVRASALDFLRSISDGWIAERVAPLIADPDPLVREAAIGLQRGGTPEERVGRVTPALADPVRSVRIAAARAVLDIPPAAMPPDSIPAMRRAMGDWRAILTAKADFPETQMVIGGTALVLRNPQAAAAAFQEAARLDPQLVDAWVMVVRIRAAVGDRDGARAALSDALAVNPGDATLLSFGDALGVAPVE